MYRKQKKKPSSSSELKKHQCMQYNRPETDQKKQSLDINSMLFSQK